MEEVNTRNVENEQRRKARKPLETPHFLTLGQAAREAGTSKATIFKALKSGRLSYVEKNSYGYKIDPAELFRVFPQANNGNTETEQTQTDANTQETAYLKLENELLLAQLADLKSDRDHWRQQATALLTYKPPASVANPNDALKPPPSFLRRLFGNR